MDVDVDKVEQVLRILVKHRPDYTISTRCACGREFDSIVAFRRHVAEAVVASNGEQ